MDFAFVKFLFPFLILLPCPFWVLVEWTFVRQQGLRPRVLMWWLTGHVLVKNAHRRGSNPFNVVIILELLVDALVEVHYFFNPMLFLLSFRVDCFRLCVLFTLLVLLVLFQIKF